jgi:hypothetical protein
VRNITRMMLLLAAAATVALANPGPPGAPEIDPASCTTALALIGGAWLVVSGRRKA